MGFEGVEAGMATGGVNGGVGPGREECRPRLMPFKKIFFSRKLSSWISPFLSLGFYVVAREWWCLLLVDCVVVGRGCPLNGKLRCVRSQGRWMSERGMLFVMGCWV